jgi:hypothetical protein
MPEPTFNVSIDPATGSFLVTQVRAHDSVSSLCHFQLHIPDTGESSESSHGVN